MSCGFILPTITITGDCTNSSLGSVYIEFTGSTAPPYTVSEVTTSGLFPTSASTTNYYVDNLPSGYYTLLVEDFCSPPTEELINIYISSGSCVSIATSGTTCGENNGLLEITFSPFYGNGTAYLYDITHNLIGSATTLTQSFVYPQQLQPGIYYVIGDDGGGCTGRSETCIIYSSTSIDYGFEVINNNSCNGLVNNGQITVTGLTGTPPYTYLWSNGQTGTTITGLTNGFYSVTVTDSNNCSLIKTTEVQLIPPVEVVSMIPTQPTCFNSDGEVIVNILGGTPPYFYSGSNGTTIVTTDQTYTFTGLSSGLFTVVVTDNGLCSDIQSVSLLTPNAFSVGTITTTNSTCSSNNGTIDIILNGGAPSGNFQYTLIDSSGNTVSTFTTTTLASFTGLDSDTYTLEIVNGSGCLFTTTVTINNTDLFTISATTNNTTCGQNNGTVTISATTGGTTPYTYQITGKPSQLTPTFTNLSSGNYIATVIDSNGCVQTTGFTIGGSSGVYFDFFTQQPINGADGEIEVLISSGEPPFTYNWSSNVNGQTGTTITGLTADTYTLTIVDDNGCVLTKNTNLSGTELISATQTFTVCSSNFENTGVVGRRGLLQMLNEGYYDLTIGDTDCILNNTVFTAKVTVDGEQKIQSFFSGTTLNEYPTDNEWIEVVNDLLLEFNGIGDVEFDLVRNVIKITNNCTDTTKGCNGTVYNSLADVEVIIDLSIDYNISCFECVTTTTTSSCVYSEWQIPLSSPCTYNLYDCNGDIYDTITFTEPGTYIVCSVTEPEQIGICATGFITQLGECEPTTE